MNVCGRTSSAHSPRLAALGRRGSPPPKAAGSAAYFAYNTVLRGCRVGYTCVAGSAVVRVVSRSIHVRAEKALHIHMSHTHTHDDIKPCRTHLPCRQGVTHTSRSHPHTPLCRYRVRYIDETRRLAREVTVMCKQTEDRVAQMRATTIRIGHCHLKHRPSSRVPYKAKAL